MYNILCFNKNMMAEVYLIKQHSRSLPHKTTFVHTYCAKVNESELKTMNYTKVSVKWHNGV